VDKPVTITVTVGVQEAKKCLEPITGWFLCRFFIGVFTFKKKLDLSGLSLVPVNSGSYFEQQEYTAMFVFSFRHKQDLN
jgi:hypothetical protein